jgi:hypothetical protein
MTFWICDFRFWIESPANKHLSGFRSRTFSGTRKLAIQNRKWAGILAVVLTMALSGVVAEAQQTGKFFRVGFLDPSNASGIAVLLDAFRQELSKLGWIEGKNISLPVSVCRAKV